MIAALKKVSPDMGGQNQQSPDQGDKQEDVSAAQAEVAQPCPEISDEGMMLSSSCASRSMEKRKISLPLVQIRSPTAESEPASKKRKVTDVETETGSTHTTRI